MCASTIHTCAGKGSVVCVAGEDNALNFLHIPPPGGSCQLTRLFSVNSHISSVKTVTVIRRDELANRFHKEIFSRFMILYDEQDLPDSMEGSMHSNENYRPVDEVFLLSAGGRAQIKLWMMNETNIEEALAGGGEDRLGAEYRLYCKQVMSHKQRKDLKKSWRNHIPEVNYKSYIYS